jgi:hypothetical protein
MVKVTIEVLFGVLILFESLVSCVRRVHLLVWRTLPAVSIKQGPAKRQDLGVSQFSSHEIALGEAGAANVSALELAYCLSVAVCT